MPPPELLKELRERLVDVEGQLRPLVNYRNQLITAINALESGEAPTVDLEQPVEERPEPVEPPAPEAVVPTEPVAEELEDLRAKITPRPEGRKYLPGESGVTLEMVRDLVRDHPASTAVELGKLIGVPTDHVRRQLQKLEANGTVVWKKVDRGGFGQKPKAYTINKPTPAIHNRTTTPLDVSGPMVSSPSTSAPVPGTGRNPTGITNKDVQQIVTAAVGRGWIWEDQGDSIRLWWRSKNANHKPVYQHKTPSSHRAATSLAARMKRVEEGKDKVTG